MADFIPYFMGYIKIGGKGLYNAVFTPVLSPVNASLASGIFTVLVIWVIMWFLYIKKIFIKL